MAPSIWNVALLHFLKNFSPKSETVVAACDLSLLNDGFDVDVDVVVGVAGDDDATFASGLFVDAIFLKILNITFITGTKSMRKLSSPNFLQRKCSERKTDYSSSIFIT